MNAQTYYAAQKANRRAVYLYRKRLSDCQYADTPSYAVQWLATPTMIAIPRPLCDPSGMGEFLHSQKYRRDYVMRLLGRFANPGDRINARLSVRSALEMRLSFHGGAA